MIFSYGPHLNATGMEMAFKNTPDPRDLIHRAFDVMISAKFEQILFFFLLLHMTCAISFSDRLYQQSMRNWPQLRRCGNTLVLLIVRILCYLFAILYPVTGLCLWAYAHFVYHKIARVSKRRPKMDDHKEIERSDTPICKISHEGENHTCTFTMKKKEILPVYIPTSSGGEKVLRAMVDYSDGGILVLKWMDVLNDDAGESNTDGDPGLSGMGRCRPGSQINWA
ncbi:hypothetical protein QBC43DRAFT_288662 [Cladorrhinum sp. PSN259]|nr:hypothetical protein QBC43DRAFT_288662 [Cladorrhinum sp. PSN259]